MLLQLNFNIKMNKTLYYLYLLLHSFYFCRTCFTTHLRFVPNNVRFLHHDDSWAVATAASQNKDNTFRGEKKTTRWNPPIMQEIAPWSSTNGAIADFLVLPGSLLSITEITEWKYFSPLKPIRELKYESEQNIVPLVLIIDPFCFCET